MENVNPGESDLGKKLAKAVKTLAKAAKVLAAGEKLAADPEKNAFALRAKAAEGLKLLGELGSPEEALNAAGSRLEALQAAAENARRRAQTAIPGVLATHLAAVGLPLEGALPELHCTFLTLRFQTEAKKPLVEIFYGPGVARLKTMPVDAGKVAAAVGETLQELAGTPLEETAFLTQLRRAYRAVCLRRDEPDDGRPAPIVEVMAEMAFARQPKRFLTDPTREAFASYGRVRFSLDLYRLRLRELNGETLRLGVASREQTRKPENHLWVPTDAQGRGTHFADLAFRRNE